MQIAGLETRGTGTCGTGTVGLGHAELGQRDWDMRNWDSGTGTRATGTICLFFLFFCDMNVERKFFFAIVCNLIVVFVTNTMVESLR